MLKSTHKPAAPQSQPAQALRLDEQPLPNGWTEHKAPTGHIYYYNAETKQSTYTRPSAPAPPLAAEPATDTAAWQTHVPFGYSTQSITPAYYADPAQGRPPPKAQHARRDFGAHDRPKTKHAIPSCSPWLLVTTKLRRRFVHNPQTGESFWKFPKDVMRGVVEFDIQRRKEAEAQKEQSERSEGAEQGASAEVVEKAEENEETKPRRSDEQPVEQQLASDEEYEEIEVTDDEQDGAPSAKRQKLSPEAGEDAVKAEVPAEIGEDDMAWQLAQMQELEASYDDSGEAAYGDAEAGEEPEGGDWTDADARAAFWELLDDHGISPFATWDAVVEAGAIIEDERYVYLPTSKARRDAFGEWSAMRAQQMKQEREKQAQQDPQVAYLAFLHKHASPKLFWPEFRRKFKKEPELKGTQLGDREREKLYREHVGRLTKLSEARRTDELRQLLADVPVSRHWNASSSTEGALPGKLVSDIRWISLPASKRDVVVREFVTTLPPAAETDADSAEEQARRERRRAEQQLRHEAALAARDRQAHEARRRAELEQRQGRAALARAAGERERALRVGRDGLRRGLDEEEDRDREDGEGDSKGE